MSENGKVMQEEHLISQRLGRIMLASSFAVAIVMPFLAVWGFRSSQTAKQQANVALARQLVSQAQSINAAGNSQQLIAILLATQSMNVFPWSEAAQLLMNNNLAAQAMAHMTHYYAVSSVAFSPDGWHVVSASYDGTIRVWESTTGKEVTRMRHNGPVYSVAFSSDGTYVASGSEDTSARVWEAASAERSLA